MSLEESIQELTHAVRSLTVALNAQRVGNDSIVHELASAPVTTLAPTEEAGNVKSNPTTDTSPPSSDESRTVTYDDVKDVTIAVSKIDKAKAVAGLARFGVTTAKALNQEQWEPYVHYMNKVHNGSIDPEASHE